MLKINNVYKTFNANTVNEKKVFEGLSLTLKEGDFVTVIGGNGAGKSTMLNVVSGAIIPDDGTVTIDGVDVTRLPEHKRAKYIGRVFQDPRMGTATDMWVEENMSIADSRGMRRGLKWAITNKDREKYRKQLALLDLGLEDRLSTKMGLLSGGQRQAVTLLMATMRKPKLLLLDEHTAALDPKTAAKVLEITDKLITENNLTALMVTHNMKDAIAHGNRLIMMNAGKVIIDVSGEEKKKLTVETLLEAFSKASGSEFTSDRALLG